MLAPPLLDWFATHKRDLPWRITKDPYHIWVSEIMAQQTQIATLLPYFVKFIATFPTVEALHQAPIDQVLKICQGMGYYNRFHNMKKAAAILVEELEGYIPTCPKVLESLPGIGAYVAGAIASTAYGAKVPAIDGNVLRVMSRIRRDFSDITKSATKKDLTAYLTAILEPLHQPGDFNQALMELGSLICKPQHPHCADCPVSHQCSGQDIWHELPVKPQKKAPKDVDKTVLLIHHPTAGFLMRQRDESLLQGLWEFYHTDKKMASPKAYLKKQGYTCQKFTPLGQHTHVFSHLKWHMTGYLCQVAEDIPLAGYVFIPPEDVQQLAIPSAMGYFTPWVGVAQN